MTPPTAIPAIAPVERLVDEELVDCPLELPPELPLDELVGELEEPMPITAVEVPVEAALVVVVAVASIFAMEVDVDDPVVAPLICEICGISYRGLSYRRIELGTIWFTDRRG
jgi:hypothetical protein